MQIMSETGRWIAECLSVCDYSEEDLFDPALNIRFGAFYLSRLLLSFDARWLSLAAYNAGEGKVRDWIDGGIDSLESIPYKETRIYVRRVERAINYYKDKKFVCFN